MTIHIMDTARHGECAEMTIEFHPEIECGVVKTPDDTMTIDLQARTVS